MLRPTSIASLRKSGPRLRLDKCFDEMRVVCVFCTDYGVAHRRTPCEVIDEHCAPSRPISVRTLLYELALIRPVRALCHWPPIHGSAVESVSMRQFTSDTDAETPLRQTFRAVHAATTLDESASEAALIAPSNSTATASGRFAMNQRTQLTLTHRESGTATTTGCRAYQSPRLPNRRD